MLIILESGERSKVWERLISSVACPIIGLSATLANIEAFYSWLVSIKSIQAASEIKILSEKLKDTEFSLSDESRAQYELKIKELSDKTKPTDFVDLIVHSERSTALHYYKFPRVTNFLDEDRTTYLDFDLSSHSTDVWSDARRLLLESTDAANEPLRSVDAVWIPDLRYSFQNKSPFAAELRFPDGSLRITIACYGDVITKTYRLNYKVGLKTLSGLDEEQLEFEDDSEDFPILDNSTSYFEVSLSCDGFRVRYRELWVLDEKFSGAKYNEIVPIELRECKHCMSVTIGRWKGSSDREYFSKVAKITSRTSIKGTVILKAFSPLEPVELNPLHLLVDVDWKENERVTDYLSNCPSSRGSQLLKLFDKLCLEFSQNHSIAFDATTFDDSFPLVEGILSRIDSLYSDLVKIVSRLVDLRDVRAYDPHVTAELRLQYELGASTLHSQVSLTHTHIHSRTHPLSLTLTHHTLEGVTCSRYFQSHASRPNAGREVLFCEHRLVQW